jgi:hypothetical protein
VERAKTGADYPAPVEEGFSGSVMALFSSR